MPQQRGSEVLLGEWSNITTRSEALVLMALKLHLALVDVLTLDEQLYVHYQKMKALEFDDDIARYCVLSTFEELYNACAEAVARHQLDAETQRVYETGVEVISISELRQLLKCGGCQTPHTRPHVLVCECRLTFCSRSCLEKHIPC